MTAEQISAIAGVLLSLFFSYFPKVRDWFDALQPNQKRIVMLGIMAAVILALFGGSCVKLVNAFACTWIGAGDALWLFVLCVIANQSAYAISPRFNRPKLVIEYVPVEQ